MRKYLATLHEKPDHHKKRFAFAVSSTFTMLLFVVWTVVKFGTPGLHVAKTEKQDLYVANQTEVSPLGTLKASVQDAWEGITNGVKEIKDSARSVDVKGSYEDIRSDALGNTADSYGQ
jgi:hypothetical protein